MRDQMPPCSQGISHKIIALLYDVNLVRISSQKRRRVRQHFCLVFTQGKSLFWQNLRTLCIRLRQAWTCQSYGCNARFRIRYLTGEFSLADIPSAPDACDFFLDLFLIHLPDALLQEESLALISRDCRKLIEFTGSSSNYPVHSDTISSIIWLCDPRLNQFPDHVSANFPSENSKALINSKNDMFGFELHSLYNFLAKWDLQDQLAISYALCPYDSRRLAEQEDDYQGIFLQRWMRSFSGILGKDQLSYLLKGWYRNDFAAKGLRCHPAMGILQDWDIEDIQQLLQ